MTATLERGSKPLRRRRRTTDLDAPTGLVDGGVVGPQPGPPPWPVTSLQLLAVVLLGFLVSVAVVGPLQHGRTQTMLRAELRLQLAEATAPVGQTDLSGQLLAFGTPLAVLRIPRLGIDEVVAEGTTSQVLKGGPGHLRSTVLPGQAGVSVLMGRQAGFGGSFARIDELAAGDMITVLTGQGEATYRVAGQRLEGFPLPPPLAASQGRLTLVTATGTPFAPSGVRRVDAQLVSTPQVAPALVLGAAGLTAPEQPMRGDGSALVVVVLAGQALLGAVVLLVWAATRWGRRQAWVVGVPVLLLLGVTVSDAASRLLPNLF